jgi:pimeloyl-ACP methyl ester carboxylesterase
VSLTGQRAGRAGRKFAREVTTTKEACVPTAHGNGIDIEYQTSGDPADPPLLLVMGLGAQLIGWPEGFVQQLASRGFFLICYDNRDSGLSTKFEGTPDFAGLFGGDASAVPYRIEDMAEDAIALLDELGVARAHVVGVSMGGMITQALVINHPARFLSACSIMSTTGDRTVGAPSGEAVTALLRAPAADREEAVAASVQGSRVIGSPGFPFDVDLMTRRAEAAYDRSYCPEGTARQLAAILGSPDRTEGLHGVTIPFLVIHGEDDPLVNVSGGRATAAAVPGSELVVIPGMGHDLPDALWDLIIDAIVANTALAAV